MTDTYCRSREYRKSFARRDGDLPWLVLLYGSHLSDGVEQDSPGRSPSLLALGRASAPRLLGRRAYARKFGLQRNV